MAQHMTHGSPFASCEICSGACESTPATSISMTHPLRHPGAWRSVCGSAAFSSQQRPWRSLPGLPCPAVAPAVSYALDTDCSREGAVPDLGVCRCRGSGAGVVAPLLPAPCCCACCCCWPPASAISVSPPLPAAPAAAGVPGAPPSAPAAHGTAARQWQLVLRHRLSRCSVLLLCDGVTSSASRHAICNQ
jgi:hypothetical protein